MLGSVHDAEDALQEALAARLARARPLRGPQLAALVALHDRHEHLPEPDRAPAQAGAAARLRPVDRPARRRSGCRRSSRSGWSPTRTSAGPRGRPRRARGALRAARERRARLRRGAPAPAGQPARRADPARGARLLRARGGRVARHDGRLGEQRPPARAQDGRRALPRAEPAGHAARARRREAARAGRGLHGRDGSAATWTRSWRCWPRTPPGRCRRSRPGSAAASAPRLHAHRAAVGRLALAPRAGARERPAGGRLLRLVRAGQAATARSRSTCSPSSGDRICEITSFIIRVHARAATSSSTCASRSSRSTPRRSRALRALRPARPPRLSRLVPARAPVSSRVTRTRGHLFDNTKAFSGFAVDDLDKAREFYGETLGLRDAAGRGERPADAGPGRRPAHADLPEARPHRRQPTRS